MRRFLADDSGQDLTEYALLLAAIVVGSAGVVIGMGGIAGDIWTVINSRLATANQAP